MIRCLLVALPLAGCAAQGSYPSLQPRPVENGTFDDPAPAAVGAVVPDPALDRRLGELDARLGTVAAGFDAAAAEAGRRAAIAKGRAAGSDAWLEAQTALAALDDWQAQASALATDVEQLAIARAATLAPAYPALATLGERAEAEARRQAETIARIQASLAPA